MAREKTPDAQVAADFFISFLNYYMDRIAEKIKEEKSMKNIIFMQGQFEGYEQFRFIIEDHTVLEWTQKREDYQEYFRLHEEKDEREWYNFTDNIPVLTRLCAYFDIFYKEWNREAEKIIKDRIDGKKEWLFFGAKSSNDIFFVRGWYSIINMFKEWRDITEKRLAEQKRIKKEQLDFDGEENGK